MGKPPAYFNVNNRFRGYRGLVLYEKAMVPQKSGN